MGTVLITVDHRSLRTKQPCLFGRQEEKSEIRPRVTPLVAAYRQNLVVIHLHGKALSRQMSNREGGNPRAT
ncbi:hypothetical protein [Reyranella sp.]|uniref:hypothetical protein n=1 Tax=Reyranella sp. TaxID=1929291 RepID=UPI003D09DA75